MNGQDPLFESPFCAGCTVVSPNDGAVDHLNRVWNRLALVERGEDQLPQPRQGPAPELAVNRVPFTELFRQVTPRRPGARDPEDAIQNQPMILRGTTATAPDCSDECLEKHPLVVRHQVSRQDNLQSQSYLESDTGALGNPVCQQNLGKPNLDDWKRLRRSNA